MALLELVDGLDQGTTLTYKPGQGERFTVTALLLGVLTDLAAPPVLTLVGPPGSSPIIPAVVHDTTGAYHADANIPTVGPAGVWVRRWTASGATPAADAIVEKRFIVDPLDA